MRVGRCDRLRGELLALLVPLRRFIRCPPRLALSNLCASVAPSADANWYDMHMKDDGVDDEERVFSRSRLCGVADSCFCYEFSIARTDGDDSIVCSWWVEDVKVQERRKLRSTHLLEFIDLSCIHNILASVVHNRTVPRQVIEHRACSLASSVGVVVGPGAGLGAPPMRAYLTT